MLHSPSSLSEAARAQVCRALNELVASSTDLWSMAKTAHWNVRGSDFLQLHALFDEAAGVVYGQIDPIAERSVTLGGTVRGTVKDAAKVSRLEAFPGEEHSGPTLAAALLSRWLHHLAVMKMASKAATDNGDPDTANLLQEFIVEAEKVGWKLTAVLG